MKTKTEHERDQEWRNGLKRLPEDEAKALLETTLKEYKLQRDFFSMARMVEQATPEQMHHMGMDGKTKEQAIAFYYRHAVKDIEQLWKQFIKQFPDK